MFKSIRKLLRLALLVLSPAERDAEERRKRLAAEAEARRRELESR